MQNGVVTDFRINKYIQVLNLFKALYQLSTKKINQIQPKLFFLAIFILYRLS